MSESRRSAWWAGALLAGLAYLAIGRVFTLPGLNAPSGRLAAWAVSGVVFAAHMAHEHFRAGSAPRALALHAAAGAALGAFALAFVAMLHAFSTEGTIRPLWGLALVLWPAIAGVPAYLVALAAGLVLARLWPHPLG